jgi:hypothetical protein
MVDQLRALITADSFTGHKWDTGTKSGTKSRQALGPTHPDMAVSLNNLGTLLRVQGEYEAAQPLYERALAICEERLGVDHPTTRTIRANLAALRSRGA